MSNVAQEVTFKLTVDGYDVASGHLWGFINHAVYRGRLSPEAIKEGVVLTVSVDGREYEVERPAWMTEEEAPQ